MVNFSDDDNTMIDKLLECDSATIVNKQLLSYLYKKCCKNLHHLYETLEQIVSANKRDQLSIYKSGKLICSLCNIFML